MLLLFFLKIKGSSISRRGGNGENQDIPIKNKRFSSGKVLNFIKGKGVFRREFFLHGVANNLLPLFSRIGYNELTSRRQVTNICWQFVDNLMNTPAEEKASLSVIVVNPGNSMEIGNW